MQSNFAKHVRQLQFALIIINTGYDISENGEKNTLFDLQNHVNIQLF